jgi:hypothetical protein
MIKQRNLQGVVSKDHVVEAGEGGGGWCHPTNKLHWRKGVEDKKWNKMKMNVEESYKMCIRHSHLIISLFLY